MKYHIPVLLNEVIDGLKVKQGGRYLDATVGDGGHTAEILKRGGTVVGIDRDDEAIERTKKRFETEIEEGRLILMRSNFDKLVSSVAFRADPRYHFLDTLGQEPSLISSSPPNQSKGRVLTGSSSVVSKMTSSGQHVDTFPPDRREGKFTNFANFDGILFDLGMSSGQIEGSGRGFSFQRDEPLDMRMDREPINRLTGKPINRYTEEYSNVTAADLVNGLGKKELVGLFLRLGQVERAGRVAEEIIRRRREGPIKTTKELADVIEKVSPRRGKLHPATKVFMALRMAVNDELGNLERALPQAVDMLVAGGRLAVISFHEGEDRIVKRFFRNDGRLMEVNRKPVTPKVEEVRGNPRSRSAKLRIGERKLAPYQSYFGSWSTSTQPKSDGTGFGRTS